MVTSKAKAKADAKPNARERLEALRGSELKTVAKQILSLSTLEDRSADVRIDQYESGDEDDREQGYTTEDLTIEFEPLPAKEIELALKTFEAALEADFQCWPAPANPRDWARFVSINYDDYRVGWVLSSAVKGDKIQLTIKAHKVS